MPDGKTILYALVGIFMIGVLVFVYESVVRYPGVVALIIAGIVGVVFLLRYRTQQKNRV